MVYSYGSNGNTPDPSSEPILVPITFSWEAAASAFLANANKKKRSANPKAKGKVRKRGTSK